MSKEKSFTVLTNETDPWQFCMQVGLCNQEDWSAFSGGGSGGGKEEGNNK